MGQAMLGRAATWGKFGAGAICVTLLARCYLSTMGTLADVPDAGGVDGGDAVGLDTSVRDAPQETAAPDAPQDVFDAGGCDPDADHSNDSLHCGNCARDCYGDPCEGGACTPTVLALGQANPNEIVVDGTNAYWTNFVDPGQVMQVPLAGGNVSILANGEHLPFGIAVDATSVYWASAADGRVRKTPIGGGSIVTLASSQVTPEPLTVDGVNAYWGNSDGTVHKVPVGGGADTILGATSLGVVWLAADPTTLLWAVTDGTVKSMALDGGSPVPFSAGPAFRIVLDKAHAYWTTYTGNSVVKASRNAGGEQTLATGTAPTFGIAVDAQYVYWSTYSSPAALLKVEIDGGTPSSVASGLSRPNDITSDAHFIYWTSADGAIRRVAK